MSFLDEHYDEIFKKYPVAELLADIASFQNLSNGGSLEKVLTHFFKEEIFKCRNLAGKKSPMEFLKNDEEVEKALEIVDRSPKFFTSNSAVSNVESLLRNQSRFTNKVANFNPRDARGIYFRYFPEYMNGSMGNRLNILDPSAGFGARMSAVLLSGQNYHAFEPNKGVYLRLREYEEFLRDNGVVDSDQVCDIRCQGSETTVKEWYGKMDVSFTSPPYFNLEFYSDDGCASTRNYGDYRKWLREYVVPTVSNIQYYLKVGSCAMINIKNLVGGGKERLFDDWYKVFEKVVRGFEAVETFNLRFRVAKKNARRSLAENPEDFEDYAEPVMSFRKVEEFK